MSHQPSERGSRRRHARAQNKATAHEHRFQDLDIPSWLTKPHQPATRLEVYTLLRRYDQARRWREKSILWKGIIALWLILTFPIRGPWGWARKAWARRHQAEDPPEQEQQQDEGNGEVVQ